MFGIHFPKKPEETTLSYSRIAALIRSASIVSAQQCTDFGRKNSDQFEGALKEFLAFYCSIACNQIGAKLKSTVSVDTCFESIRHPLFTELFNVEGVSQTRDGRTVLVSLLANTPQFRTYFHAYWNGDLNSLRISQAEIDEVAKKGVTRPNAGPTGDAHFALLVRNCRLHNEAQIIPPTIVFALYGKIIREQGEHFLKLLNSEIEGTKDTASVAIADAVVMATFCGSFDICKSLQKEEVFSENEFTPKYQALSKELGALCLSQSIAIIMDESGMFGRATYDKLKGELSSALADFPGAVHRSNL